MPLPDMLRSLRGRSRQVLQGPVGGLLSHLHQEKGVVLAPTIGLSTEPLAASCKTPKVPPAPLLATAVEWAHLKEPLHSRLRELLAEAATNAPLQRQFWVQFREFVVILRQDCRTQREPSSYGWAQICALVEILTPRAWIRGLDGTPQPDMNCAVLLGELIGLAQLEAPEGAVELLEQCLNSYEKGRSW